MNFSKALEALKANFSVAREGWTENCIFIQLQKPDYKSKMTRPYIYIDITKSQSAEKIKVPWLPDHEDLLADDWLVVADISGGKRSFNP